MIKKNISRRQQQQNEIEAQPLKVHLDLLAMWVQMAAESHGENCADAWLNVRRLSHALEVRAARYTRTWRG